MTATSRDGVAELGRVVLVTGTSTEVGKTITTAALAAASGLAPSAIAVVKPGQTGVAPGEDGDAATVARLVPGVLTAELARYREPLAPLTAARVEGAAALTRRAVREELAAIVARPEFSLILIEGAGGVLVPLGWDEDAEAPFGMLEIADDLAAAGIVAEFVIVAAAGLGTLNHTALTARAIAADPHRATPPRRIAGIVVGSWPDEPDLAARTNLADLPSLTGVRLLGRVPERAGQLNTVQFCQSAAAWFSPTERPGPNEEDNR